jgi:hypothetical protein
LNLNIRFFSNFNLNTSTAEEGCKTVELFTAIYRSQRDGKPVKFPLKPEYGREDMDGRI